MSLQSITAPEGVDTQLSLGFIAQSVVVENFSNSWIWLASASKFVAPWRSQTVQLTQATDQANIEWRNPPLIPVSPPTTGQAFTYWSDASATTTQPSTLFTGQTQASVVDSGTVNGNDGPHTHSNIPIPAGTVCLAVQFAQGSVAFAEAVGLTVIGNQTGAIYFNNLSAATLGPGGAPGVAENTVPTSTFNPTDTSVNVTFKGVGTGTGGYSLVAYPFIPLPAQSDVFGLMVNIIGAEGFSSNPGSGVPVSDFALPLARLSTISLYIINIASGGNASIIAGVVGTAVVVWGYTFQLVTGNTGLAVMYLESTSSKAIGSVSAYSVGAGVPTISPPLSLSFQGGIRCANGDGVRVRSDAASTIASNVLVTVYFTSVGSSSA